MDLKTRIAQIQAIPGLIAHVGHGPTDAHGGSLRLVDEYFEAFASARNDDAYVEFMVQYSGLYLHDPQYAIVVDVFGFAGVSSLLMKRDTHFWVEGESRPDENGFLIFCDGKFIRKRNANPMLDELIGAGFGFDLTGSRPRGVYRALDPDTKVLEMSYFCASFDEWLQILIDTQGNLVSS
ncbi:MAG: hypothetical protein U0670_16500 [Anaerolineae bacterium]